MLYLSYDVKSYIRERFKTAGFFEYEEHKQFPLLQVEDEL